jgi:hypothetical protein
MSDQDNSAEASVASKPPKKKAGHIFPLALIGLCVVVGGLFLYMNAGNIAKSITEQIASKTLGVKVTIASFVIKPAELQVDVGGLKIANLPGYAKPHLMTVDNITVKAHSLEKELMNFDIISVDGATIYLEVEQNGTNLTDLKKNLNSRASKSGDGPASAIKVMIDEVLINNARLEPSVTLLDKDLSTVTLPDIVIRGVGKKQNGVLISEAMTQVVDHVIKVATKASSEAGFLTGMSVESLKDIQSQLGLSGNFVDQVKSDIGKAAEGIKGLFSD